MTRPVFALFASRPEAEAARARLASVVQVEWTRMLAKDTAAAVGDLKLDQKQAKAYHEALQRGDHLLVAKVARGEDPKRILRALAATSEPEPPLVEPQQSYSIEDPQSSQPPPASLTGEASAHDVRMVEASPAVAAAGVAASDIGLQPAVDPRSGTSGDTAISSDAAEGREPRAELRIGEPEVIHRRPGTSTNFEPIPLGVRGEAAPGRRITYEEVEALGLLKDRTIEVVEMREEPVVAKEVFVREEVIVRKTVSERTETVSDTLRRTQVEVEDLSGSESDR